MWYVVQTITGKEADLVDVIDRVLKGEGYEKCFVPKRECVWRVEGHYRVYIEPLFPSYMFVETDAPEQFFFALKRVPRLSKLLGDEGHFWSVKEEEEKLLQILFGEEGSFVVRRSLVRVDADGEIISAQGALSKYVDKIIKKKLRKRSVVIEIPFLGALRRIRLGIKLEEDEGQAVTGRKNSQKAYVSRQREVNKYR